MSDRRNTDRSARVLPLALLLSASIAAACATSAQLQSGQRAEDARDYDRAVVDYTNAVRANPDDQDARQALQRAKLQSVAGARVPRPPPGVGRTL